MGAKINAKAFPETNQKVDQAVLKFAINDPDQLRNGKSSGKTSAVHSNSADSILTYNSIIRNKASFAEQLFEATACRKMRQNHKQSNEIN